MEEHMAMVILWMHYINQIDEKKVTGMLDFVKLCVV